MVKTVVLKTRYKGTLLHALYNGLIKNPPIDYKVTVPQTTKKSQLGKISFQIDSNLYKRFLYNFGALPYICTQLSGPNIEYENCDLIFAAQHIIKTEKPWVVDLEFANALVAYCNFGITKNIVSKKLKSKECKAILPWSEWGANTLIDSIDCKDFKEKIKIVRYTVPPKQVERKKPSSSIRMLFVGSINQCGRMREMYKGLYENVQAFIQIQKEYDGLELVIRSSVTPEVREIVKNYANIKIIDTPLTPSELEHLYISSDIFPHAGFEGLNLSVLEAMSYGLPVIVTSQFNTPELIKHMKNGILIDFPEPKLFRTKNGIPNEYANPPLGPMKRFRQHLIDQIKKSMKQLIEDPSLQNSLGREAKSTIENGEFSLKHRNFLLKEIFDEATK